MIFYVPLFAVVSALLRWLKVTSMAIYLPAIAAPPMVLTHWLVTANARGGEASTTIATALAIPSALAAALVMGRRNRA
ncbi:MAG: hypothetical protein C0481_06070 [Phenylobacterium sp.]|nr:hypothetical protein [Phenylobacterium sp.]